ncbi:CHAT domain-containing protein [Phenylobacterium sp.]|uniref:CHAT domain-containing protein n=1 Tax=Phenylobacterium sp. TaxID=1871053 RepID=UPI002ED7DBA4
MGWFLRLPGQVAGGARRHGAAWRLTAAAGAAFILGVAPIQAAEPAPRARTDQNPDDVMRAAYDAGAVDCASGAARRLFSRAAELGAAYAAIAHARSFDPLKCPKVARDGTRAAQLYAAIAEGDGPSRTDAVWAWADLVDARLATPAPFSTRAELLGAYGAKLLRGPYSDDVLRMLETAAQAGYRPALATLRSASEKGPGGERVAWAGYDREKASCTLGRVLVAGRPDERAYEEGFDRLGDCPGDYDRMDLVKARLGSGTVTVADRMWLVAAVVRDRDYNHWAANRNLMLDSLEDLSGRILPAADAAKVGALIYDVAQRRFVEGEIGWPELMASFERARKLDGSPTKFADHLFAASTSRRVPVDPAKAGVPAGAADLRSGLDQAASIYGRDLNALSADQLRRLLHLAWHDIGGRRPDDGLQEILEHLARKGDSAARHTLALLPLQPDLLQHRYPAKAVTASLQDAVCGEDNLTLAISKQTTLYQRLSQMRGAPSVSGEVSRSALRGIRDGSAVALFQRDALKSCVWLIGARGKVAFGEVYVPPGAVEANLRTFFRVSAIDARQALRAPIPRASRGARGLHRTPPAADGSHAALKDRAAVKALAAILFPGDTMGGLTEVQRLVIVPYGALGNVPFDALPLDEGDFISRFSTTVAPSFIDLFAAASAIQAPSENGRRASAAREGYVRIIPGCEEDAAKHGEVGAPSSALVIGDPSFADPDFELPQLAGARAEAKAVAELMGVTPLLGRDATRNRVTSAAQNADLIYLATHGVSYGDTGLEGFIALADGDRWTAREVQSACLIRATLAVLSACQTGLGQNVSGGVIGLARGFQIAGVDNVVMSLWNVDDKVTQGLMLEFMSRIKAGQDASSALRDAKLQVRAQPGRSDPRYWASFTLFSAKQPAVVAAGPLR